MAVQFIVGRAGSGKTAGCYEQIVQACKENPLGRPIFLVVPNQATFQVERELTARTGGFARLSVVSFELLGRQIASECGDVAVPEVTAIGRQMILGHLLREHQDKLRYFQSVARRPGLPATLDATFSEFERAGKTAADLNDMIDPLVHADPGDALGPSLQAKLADLRFLYDRYSHYLGEERLDQSRRLRQVLKQLERCPLLRGAEVYVDDFYTFTDYERRLLAGVGKLCVKLEINLTLDPDSPTVGDPRREPDELSLFHRTEEAYRRLTFAMREAGATVLEPVAMKKSGRFVSPQLALIERAMFASGEKVPGDGARAGGGSHTGPDAAEKDAGLQPGITFIETPDPRAEIDSVVRGIRTLLAQGFRLRDVAVLARNLEPYQRLLDISFREHGMPFYFVDRRRSASHHPLLVFVRCIFQIARGGWRPDAVMALLRTGLAGVELVEADEIENYLIQHRLGGVAWDDTPPWTYQLRQLAADDGAPPEEFQAESIDAKRRSIAEKLRPFLEVASSDEPMPLRRFATQVFELLERFDVRQSLTHWIELARSKNELELAGEHEQVWAELTGLFDQMVDLLGDEQVTSDDFADILEAGLDGFDLALTPQNIDQVLVGQVDRTRTPKLRAVFLLGLNQGQFPAAPRDVTILSQPERRALHARDVELDPGPDRRLLDERFLGYIACTRATEMLVVSRPLADSDCRPTAESEYWERLRAMFPEMRPLQVLRRSDDARDVRHIATPGQLLASLMHWAREADAPSTAYQSMVAGPTRQDSRPALYQWLAGRKPEGSDDALSRMRDRAWRALSYRNEATLQPTIRSELFSSPLEAGVGQLETFAACPFRHFARHGLKLATRESQTVTGLDLSQIYHKILQSLAGELLKDGMTWEELSPEAARIRIVKYARDAAQQLRGQLMLSSARNRYFLQRIERTLEQVAATLRESQIRSRFRLAHAGVSFGARGGLAPYKLSTPTGSEVQLRGKIDRVDVLDSGDGKPAIAIFDYRLGAAAMQMGLVYHGLSLQLLAYLLALAEHGEKLTGQPVEPAAAFSSPLLRGLTDVRHPSESLDPADPRFHLRVKSRGVFDAAYFPALDTGTGRRENSEVFQAFVNKDGQIGRRNASDAADPLELDALLQFVRRKLGEIADQIMNGNPAVAPYRLGRKTPCPGCEYRAVCRFEPGADRYRQLITMGRTTALQLIVQETGGAGHGN